MKPLISICVTNYNYERFIKETLDSVLSQTYKNFEVIIIDNASTDSSMDIIKSYNDPRIKVFQNEENIGLYQNLNKCMEKASGELICLLHTDDVYTPNFLEEVVKAYNEYPEHKFFITGVYFWHSQNNKKFPWHPYKSGGVISQTEALIRLAFENNIGNGLNVVMHRDALEKVGNFSNKYRYAADAELWLRMVEEYEFVYIPKLLTYYRIHSYNLTHSVYMDMFKEGEEICHTRIMNSKILSKALKEKLQGLKSKNIINKIYHTGIKYKTNNIAKELRPYIPGKHGLLSYSFWVYKLIDQITPSIPDIKLKLISVLGRFILFPYRQSVRQNIERLISSSVKA